MILTYVAPVGLRTYLRRVHLHAAHTTRDADRHSHRRHTTRHPADDRGRSGVVRRHGRRARRPPRHRTGVHTRPLGSRGFLRSLAAVGRRACSLSGRSPHARRRLALTRTYTIQRYDTTRLREEAHRSLAHTSQLRTLYISGRNYIHIQDNKVRSITPITRNVQSR